MVDKTEITRPIEIKDNSIERVAYELMEKIAGAESFYDIDDLRKKAPREYYLKLFNQCHKTVSSKVTNIDDLLNS